MPGVERGAAHHRAACIAGSGFDPAEINRTARREIGGEYHVAKPALAAISDLRRAGDILDLAARFPQLELARFLGNQREIGAGDEGDCPRFIEGREFGNRKCIFDIGGDSS